MCEHSVITCKYEKHVTAAINFISKEIDFLNISYVNFLYKYIFKSSCITKILYNSGYSFNNFLK